MMPNIEIHEKLLHEHRQQLQREAERRHLLERSGLHHRSKLSHLLRRIGNLIMARRSSMKAAEHIEEFVAESAEETGCVSVLQETMR